MPVYIHVYTHTHTYIYKIFFSSTYLWKTGTDLKFYSADKIPNGKLLYILQLLPPFKMGTFCEYRKGLRWQKAFCKSRPMGN